MEVSGLQLPLQALRVSTTCQCRIFMILHHHQQQIGKLCQRWGEKALQLWVTIQRSYHRPILLHAHLISIISVVGVECCIIHSIYYYLLSVAINMIAVVRYHITDGFCLGDGWHNISTFPVRIVHDCDHYYNLKLIKPISQFVGGLYSFESVSGLSTTWVTNRFLACFEYFVKVDTLIPWRDKINGLKMLDIEKIMETVSISPAIVVFRGLGLLLVAAASWWAASLFLLHLLIQSAVYLVNWP